MFSADCILGKPGRPVPEDTVSGVQTIFAASAEGQSAKLNIGKIVTDSRGDWLLPIWRERSNPSCWAATEARMEGVPGVMGSSDKVGFLHLVASLQAQNT